MSLMILVLFLLLIVGCVAETIPPTRITVTPTEVWKPLAPVVIEVVQATLGPPATLTAVPTITRDPTDTPVPTVTATATATAWPTWTNTPMPTATATATATAWPTNTVMPTATTGPTNTPWPTLEPTPSPTETAVPTVVAAGGSTIPFGTPPESLEALVACLAPIYITPSYEMVEWTGQDGTVWHMERGNLASVDPIGRTVTFVNGVVVQYDAPAVYVRYQRQSGNWWESPENWQVTPQLFTWEQVLTAMQLALSQGKVVGIQRITENSNTLVICHAH